MMDQSQFNILRVDVGRIILAVERIADSAERVAAALETEPPDQQKTVEMGAITPEENT